MWTPTQRTSTPRIRKPRTRKQVVGDFLISLAVVVWTLGGAFGAYQVIAYLYERLGWLAAACAVILLPIAMLIVPVVALLRDGTWALFAGTWDAFMLGWILQLAGGLIADRPRSGEAPHEGDVAAPDAADGGASGAAPDDDTAGAVSEVETRARAEGQ